MTPPRTPVQGPENGAKSAAQADVIARRGKAAGADGGILQKLKDLPRPAQVLLGVAIFGLAFMLFGNRGGQVESGPNAANITNARALQNGGTQVSPTAVFKGLESDRPQLMQNWLEQNRREIADLKDQYQNQSQQRDQALAEALQQNAEVQREMRQMMSDFTAEIRNMQASSDRDRETLSQLAEEQRKLQLNAPVDGTSGGGVPMLPRRQERINQTPLGGGTSALPGRNSAANRPISQANQVLDEGAATPPPPLPFMPPIGFIRGTMLNGVDALVGGQPTPSLVRLQGAYKTAMNTTVSLDGCLALVEFQGEISTERAVGKPARMTCVYPDQGAMTYALSGYVVDAEDGIIGIPGVFYEGDASRIAAAMMADFAAGVSAAVAENNNTYSLDQNGNAVRTMSGDQVRSQMAGGVNSATKSLRDYLMERVNRVLPFIRLDATRELHMVILSGVELRTEGSPWTVLFDAQAADAARANANLPNEPVAQNARGTVTDAQGE